MFCCKRSLWLQECSETNQEVVASEISYLIHTYYSFSGGVQKCPASNVKWCLRAEPAVTSLQSKGSWDTWAIIKLNIAVQIRPKANSGSLVSCYICF